MEKYLCYILRRRHSYSVIIPFICQKCGRCCITGDQWGDLFLQRARVHLGYPNTHLGFLRFIKETGLGEVVRDGFRLSIGETCPFLTKEKLCSIYPERPDGCKVYPLKADFGVHGVKCPGYSRICHIVSKIRQGIICSRISEYGTLKAPRKNYVPPTEKRLVEYLA